MRLIDADALFINLDGMMAVSPTGYIHGDTVADMISDAPTVNPWEVVYDELTKISLFCGRYDAEHAADRYRYGIAIVMENIAYHAGKQDEFNE